MSKGFCGDQKLLDLSKKCSMDNYSQVKGQAYTCFSFYFIDACSLGCLPAPSLFLASIMLQSSEQACLQKDLIKIPDAACCRR